MTRRALLAFAQTCGYTGPARLVIGTRQSLVRSGAQPRAAPADDITPELYLYSVLQDNLLYQEMKTVIAEMQRRQPGDADVAVMADYVKAKRHIR